jgi:CRP-like cAMP-binding protein
VELAPLPSPEEIARMDFSPLHAYFTKWAPLPDAEWRSFEQGLSTARLAAGESFIRFGGPASQLGFVTRGLMKAYYLTRKGHEYIRQFIAEDAVAAAVSALFQGQGAPAEVELVAIEPTELIVCDAESLRRRYADHWTWQQIGRAMAEKGYVLRERRQFELMTMSAEERLRSFFRQFPGLAARVSQKDLAGYLAITPESLSRLRAKLKGES